MIRKNISFLIVFLICLTSAVSAVATIAERLPVPVAAGPERTEHA